jgi:adenosylmethionine-8-amino-7-oxononanoate aminotransferase
MTNTSLVDLDRQFLIHPVSNFRQHEQRGATVLAAGHGAYLRDADGRELLDAFSGLWCVNTGYGHESIVQAANEQMRRLPYATGYFGYGSEPAIRLAARLVELAPASLRHVYFTLGGSDAVDSALRYISYYYNVLGQEQRTQFISLQRGYHGSSSVGAGLTAVPSPLQPAATQPALPALALRLPQSGRRRSAGADRGLGRGAARQGGGTGRRARSGLLLRADPGVRRRHRAAARLAQGHGRHLPRARHPVRGR